MKEYDVYYNGENLGSTSLSNVEIEILRYKPSLYEKIKDWFHKIWHKH